MFRPSNVHTMFRPIPLVFTLLRTLLHFFALTKISTLLFSSASALFGQNTGVGYPLTSRNKGIMYEVNKDRAAKHRVAPSKSQIAAPPALAWPQAPVGLVFCFQFLHSYNGTKPDAQAL